MRNLLVEKYYNLMKKKIEQAKLTEKKKTKEKLKQPKTCS